MRHALRRIVGSAKLTALLAFHELAAAAGDGLHPELAALFEHQRRLALAAIEDLSDHRQAFMRQAGPNPGQARKGALPTGVVRFPQPQPATFQPPAHRRSAKG